MLQTNFSAKPPVNSVFGQNLRVEKNGHAVVNNFSQSLCFAAEEEKPTTQIIAWSAHEIRGN